MQLKPFRHMIRKHHLFVSLLVPYILFMLLAMVLGWLLYNKTYDLVEKEATRSNMQLLDQVKEMMDRRLSEINTIALQILNDPKIMGFQQVTDPFDGVTTYKVLETQKGLFNYNISNNFVQDYYLFFPNSNLALSSQSTYELPKFYQYVLHYNHMDYETWRNELFGTYYSRRFLPARNVQFQEQPYSMLTYLQSLGSPGRVQGVLAILIDSKEIEKLMRGIDLSGDGWASIVDEKGQVIKSISDKGKQPQLDRTQFKAAEGVINPSDATNHMMITYTFSSYNGWSYMVAQPPEVALQKVFYIKKITFSIVFAFLALGALLAYLFAYRNSKPLMRIISTIMERFNGVQQRTGDAYGFIQASVAKLIDNNRELKDEIERQAPFLRETFFERLLKGEFLAETEIELLLRHQKMDIAGGSYAIGILHFQRIDNGLNADILQELDINRVIMKEVLRLTLGESIYFHDVAEDKIALLFINHAGDSEHFRSYIEKVVGQVTAGIQQQLNIIPAVVVGGIYESLLDVSRSYEEARQSVAYAFMEARSGIVWFDKLSNDNGGYYYPGEVEIRLMNYTKAGETTEVDKLLQMLYQENFAERHLSIAMQQLFLCEVLGSLVKIHDQLRLDDSSDFRGMFHQAYANGDPVLVYRTIADRYVGICNKIDKHKKSRNVKLIDDIVEWIRENYGQADLGLDAVADQMNISKVYLSQFFKEQTGVNFSEYLENLRLERAQELLACTSLSIRDIADQVGYHSSNTFCRAFKRSTGLSATVYRSSSITTKSTIS